MNAESPMKSFLKEHIHSLAILAALVLLALVFTYLTDGNFLEKGRYIRSLQIEVNDVIAR